jgi:uncharacterized protein (TIGR02757 family)
MVDPQRLRDHLDAVVEGMDLSAAVQSDPVRCLHRYERPLDVEIAGLFAALMAFGRVDLFLPVLEVLLDRMDEKGGPRRWCESLSIPEELAALGHIQYRWTHGSHLVLVGAVVREALKHFGSLEGLFASFFHGEDVDAQSALSGVVDWLRNQGRALAGECGLPEDVLPRAVKHLLAHPSGGSACKRWHLYLRWMVRKDEVDPGIWTALDSSALILPLDTHTHRLSRFLGLTTRTDGSWKTAVEITAALRTLDPKDPVRFDFAMAHLGISGACKGYRDPEVCPGCVLDPVCQG